MRTRFGPRPRRLFFTGLLTSAPMDHANPTDALLVDPFGGMAGDMFLAALLDLGDPRFTIDDLRGLAEALVPGEARLAAEHVWRGSLRGLHLAVTTPETDAAPHRGLSDLVALLRGAPGLDPRAVRFAEGVLERIAVAEGHVHGCSPEEVHFHEVGAVDSLIDAAGAGLAVARLGVGGAFVAPPLLGSGEVKCAHGTMPVPAPATAELLRGHATRSGGGGERCTPTGAAILAQLAGDAGTAFGDDVGEATARSVGYGAGTRDPRTGPPNLLRVMLVTRAGADGGAPDRTSGEVDEIQLNLDDMTPEDIGALVRDLREAGALEVWTAPVQMKKDRPGALLTALARPEDRARLADLALARSTSFGLRWRRVQRLEAGRAFDAVEVDGVRVGVKRRLLPGREDVFLEQDDVEALSRHLKTSLREARERALAALTGRDGS